MLYLIAVILGLVEGITEFIPVSSTGHLIMADHVLGFHQYVGKDVADCFEIFIQLGAILAVIVAYPGRFVKLLAFRDNRGFSGLRGIGLLAISTIPPGLVGLAGRGYIKEHLFNPTTVAMGLGVGAIWILLMEWLLRPRVDPQALTTDQRASVGRLLPPSKGSVDAFSWWDALAIGCFQCLALWPGMSRSSSTILGGMLIGVDRKAATEYSFFAAVPLLAAAGLYELYKSLPILSLSHLPLFAVGFVVSFLSAWLAVKLFIRFLSRHTLAPFGWYRLAVTGLVFWALRGL